MTAAASAKCSRGAPRRSFGRPASCVLLLANGSAPRGWISCEHLPAMIEDVPRRSGTGGRRPCQVENHNPPPGAAQAVLMSVWRTCWQQGCSALDFLSQVLRDTPVALVCPSDPPREPTQLPIVSPRRRSTDTVHQSNNRRLCLSVSPLFMPRVARAREVYNGYSEIRDTNASKPRLY
jgi:hypothetical protein